MKKFLFATLALVISTSAFSAEVNIVKLTGKYGEVSDSGDSFAVKTTKGDLWIYSEGISQKDTNTLRKAMKSKSCVKVTENSNTMVTKVEIVSCPNKLKPIKQSW